MLSSFLSKYLPSSQSLPGNLFEQVKTHIRYAVLVHRVIEKRHILLLLDEAVPCGLAMQ